MCVVSKGTFGLALQGEAAVSAKVQGTAHGVLCGTTPGLVRPGTFAMSSQDAGLTEGLGAWVGVTESPRMGPGDATHGHSYPLMATGIGPSSALHLGVY